MTVIYLDNAASTWPKPPEVGEAMRECLEQYAANPGRGGHRLAMQAAKTLLQARVKLAQLFNIPDPNDLFFMMNATQALNQAIKGWLRPGDHAITTSLEHNSVRRPLEFLKRRQNVEISYVRPREDWRFSVEDFAREIKANTRLIVVSHVSNLLGVIVPVAEIGALAKRHGIPLLVDASQSAGVLPIDVRAMNIDMLAFPGHKGLYGPQGTGGLYVNPSLELEPLLHGGTGSHSQEIDQPAVRPERYESGTPNTVGLAGLAAGVDFVLKTGIAKIHAKEMALAEMLWTELEGRKEIVVYGPRERERRTAVISFNVKGVDPVEVATILDQFGIAVRAGYHCAPLAHETAGSLPDGSVRVSFGYFNTEKDVTALLDALDEVIAACR
ncbi:aminotransferase class V-fold PLP-dependent enzyme [Bacillaceae bacterium]